MYKTLLLYKYFGNKELKLSWVHLVVLERVRALDVTAQVQGLISVIQLVFALFG